MHCALLCTVQVEREIATRLIEIAALKKETDALSKARLQKLEEEVRFFTVGEPLYYAEISNCAACTVACMCCGDVYGARFQHQCVLVHALVIPTA
jgi:hypothetical protein